VRAPPPSPDRAPAGRRSPRVARAEVIESIVARVNDDIITQSELAEAERSVIEEIYSKNKGDALQKELARAKNELLRDLITKKLLIQQAERMYDITKMQDAFVRQFKEQQKIGSNTDLERILREEGLTLDEFKTRLIEINAPSSVVDMEVRDKISVSDAEVEKYYNDHQAEMSSADKATYREIVMRLGEDRDAVARQGPGSDAPGARRRGLRGAREGSLAGGRVVRGNVLGPFLRGELSSEIETRRLRDEAGRRLGSRRDRRHGPRDPARDAETSVTPPLATVRDRIYDRIEARKFESALHDYLEIAVAQQRHPRRGRYVPRIPRSSAST
jgi:peptidyl-prolyl cis-trans isomerase SurA